MQRPTLVVVDDEEEGQLLALKVLEPLKIDVQVAGNGREALKLAQELLPDLILLDITMPDLSGLDVLEKLRADPATRNLAVIMLTSRQFLPEFNRAKELGAKGFLPKPYSAEGLVSRVCLELGLPAPARTEG